MSLSISLAGSEMVYELCMETQAFLAQNGGKIFSSFHEEMEERKKAEAKRRSEGTPTTIDHR